MILHGRLVDAVGGGVSQVATTVYNAAFFAGVHLIEHTPHQFYISRYPMGPRGDGLVGGPELDGESSSTAAWPVSPSGTRGASTAGRCS
jgi:hypothetical protein